MTPQDSYSLTQSQLLLWTGHKMNPHSPMYNMAFIYDLQGEIDPLSFQKAFQLLVEQNEVLRAVFKEEAGLPTQSFLPHLSCRLETIELGSVEEVYEWQNTRSQNLLNLEECCFDSVLIKVTSHRYFWYFNQHHLISDAWSGALLVQEMGRLYHSSLNEKEHPATLPSFREFIPVEQDARFNKKNEKSRLFWEERAGELPIPPRLYGEKGNPTVSESQRIELSLGVQRSEKLRKLSQEQDLRGWTQDMTLFNIFSTALFVYLYRISGQRSIAIGSPAHNRPTKTFKQTPGVFIELFPLLAHLEEGESFTDVYKRIRTQSNEFLRHAKPGTSSFRLSRQFNVVLNYIHAKFSKTFGDLPMQGAWVHPNHCDPGHHLRLQVHDLNDTGNIQLNFDLNTSVFDEEKRKKVVGHFLKVLDAFIEDRSQEIEEFSLEEELIQLPTFEAIPEADHSDETVLALIQKQVKKQGDTPALMLGDTSWTYKELWEQANAISSSLIEMGIKPGERVALFTKRSKEFLAAILGVWKTGATYIPLPSDTPAARLNFILQDAECSAILSESALSERLDASPIPVILLDQIEQKPGLQDQNFTLDIRPSDLAYIMYTSGSTGTPKGVMISHEALSHYIQWAASAYALDTASGFSPVFQNWI